jgi:hypothetical protein
MGHSPAFLIDICDEFIYRAKSGNRSKLDRWEASSHRWEKDGFTTSDWHNKFKCDCGALMHVSMGRIESNEPDMQVIIQKNRHCLDDDERKIKDIIE